MSTSRPPKDATHRREVLTNLHSARVKEMVSLSRRSARQKTGLIRVEGPQSVTELLRHAPGTARDVYFEDSAAAGPLAELFAQAAAAVKWVHLTSAALMQAVAPSSQGVWAVAEASAIPADIDLTAPGPVVVLPAVQDPGNTGTLIRLADAAGAVGVYLGADTANADAPKVIRASAGSVFHLPLAEFADTAALLDQLNAAGYEIWAADGAGEETWGSGLATPAALAGRKIAWVFGNEAHGVAPEILAAADHRLSIPIYGQAESLNVAAAAALCLYLAPGSPQ